MSEEQPVAARPYAEPSVEFVGVDVDSPLVGIVMGSKSDMAAMETAEKELTERGFDWRSG